MNKILLIFLVIIALAIPAYLFINRPTASEENFSSIDTFQDPLQLSLLDPQNVLINSKGLAAIVTPFAKYKISAVILSKKKYPQKWASIISPLDFALGWGDVSKPENVKNINVRQTMRWYRYKFDAEVTISQSYISTHSSNHHIIPANDNIRKAVLFTKKHDKIVLEGYLVNISGKYKNGNISWRSSHTRTDTGDGSCEILYVTSVKLGTNIYR